MNRLGVCVDGLGPGHEPGSVLESTRPRRLNQRFGPAQCEVAVSRAKEAGAVVSGRLQSDQGMELPTEIAINLTEEVSRSSVVGACIALTNGGEADRVPCRDTGEDRIPDTNVDRGAVLRSDQVGDFQVRLGHLPTGSGGGSIARRVRCCLGFTVAVPQRCCTRDPGSFGYLFQRR